MKTIGVSPWALTLLFSLLSIGVRSQSADDFNPGADNGVTSLLLQPDGKVLVGGRFRTLAGVARKTFGRVNADGTADLSFDPALSGILDSFALPLCGSGVLPLYPSYLKIKQVGMWK